MGSGVGSLCNSGDLANCIIIFHQEFNIYYIDAAPFTLNISTVSAISVLLTFNLHEFSLPIVQHRVILTRVTGRRQMLCPTITHKIPSEIISSNRLFVTDLEEYSLYSITVDTVFTGQHTLRTVSEIFTPSAGIQQNL